MELTQMQDAALLGVKRWHDAGGEGVYRLFGFAGTGKTSLAKLFAQGISGNVVYAAFTGKAAYVLRQKGCENAQTIHQLIYKPAEKNRDRLMEIKKDLEDLVSQLTAEGLTQAEVDAHAEVKRVTADLAFEQSKHKRPSFMLNPESSIKDASLVVIDECSMVDERIGEDLMSFNVPILVLGDPAQLPPVMGAGYFTNHKPDVLLTEIHRQAEGNPILRLATDVREGRGLRLGQYGASRVINRAAVDRDEVLAFDQVLVGTNKMRRGTNDRIRELKGRETGVPVMGDRVVCLRNNHEVGLLNGGLWNVNAAVSTDGDSVELDLGAEDGTSNLTTTAHSHYFIGKEPPFWDIKERDCFDYGYALTTHKAQGSQWPSVYIFDESRVFRQDAQKWLYTAITRAAERVVVVVD